MKIIGATRHGILVEIVLPDQIPNLTKKEGSEFEVDIDSRDFLSDQKLRKVILEREQHRCFYLGRKITEEIFVSITWFLRLTGATTRIKIL